MASPTTKRWSSGLFRGSRYTTEPYDDSSDTLQFILNGYVPDAVNGSGVYSRPGFTELDGPDVRVWGIHGHTALDGTPYNFVVANQKLYRVSVAGNTFTDVTPLTDSETGAALFIEGSTRVFFRSLGDVILVNDGVNTPWAITNAASTPVVAQAVPFSAETTTAVLKMGTTNTAIGWDGFTATAGGVTIVQTNNDVGVALPTGTIPTAQWGIYHVTIDSSATITVTAGAANYTTGYATQNAAFAALPAIPANSASVGYFTVRANLAAPFIANTSALATGTGGNPASATNYYAAFRQWTAFGQPEIYAGSVFFILQSINNGEPARSSIGWSEPNFPLVGYQQTDYDNLWELTQTGSTPLYRLVGTNDALYYSRRLSWGALAGTPNINFANTATHDVVSGNVGCVSPAGACLFLNYVYFLDQQGRPWRFAVGGTPEPLWLQLRGIFAEAAADYDSADVEDYGWMAVEPSTNTVLFDFTNDQLNYALTLEANTGRFLGGWCNGADTAPLYAGLLTYGASATADNQTVLAMAMGTTLWYVQRPDVEQFWDVNDDATTTAVTFRVSTGQLGYSLFDKMQTQNVGVLLSQPQDTGTLPPTLSVGITTTQTSASVAPLLVQAEGSIFGSRGRYVATFGRQMGRDVSAVIATSVTATTSQLAVLRVEATAVVSEAGIRDA